MWDLTSSAADFLFNLSNVVLIIGAAAVLIGTIGSIKMGAVREEFSNERIAANEAKTAEAVAVSDVAKARAAEAQLALERFKAPRTLAEAQLSDITSKMSKWATLPKSGASQSVAVFSVSDTFESKTLADQIATALGPEGAKWTINRFPVMYGMQFSVSGVALLIPKSNPRGLEVANDLANVLNGNGITAFIAPERRDGCEEMKGFEQKADIDPSCSAISVMVGEKPK